MTSTTPQNEPSSGRRSNSRSRPPSRSQTPLRPSSRSSLRESSQRAQGPYNTATPLEQLEPAFADLSDAMADLEGNMMHLQLMHESLARFSESFAGFLYGMNMNAFCVDFPEVRYISGARSTQWDSEESLKIRQGMELALYGLPDCSSDGQP